MTAALLSGAAVTAATGLLARSGGGRARLSLAGVAPPARRGDPSTAALTAAGSVAAVVVTGWPLPWVLLTAAVILVGWLGVRRALRRRRRERLAAAVPDVATALAAELRGGAHPVPALLAAADNVPMLAGVMTEAATQARGGGSAAAVLQQAARDLDGLTGLAHLGAAWAAVEEAGVAVAPVLDRLGEALDAEQDAASRMRAQLAGPRATALLLAGLPVLGVGLGQAVGAHPLHLLLGRPFGWALCAGAVLLDALGLAWTARIVRGVAGPGRPP